MRPSFYPCIFTGAAQWDRLLCLLEEGEMVTAGHGGPQGHVSGITLNPGFPNHVELLALVAPPRGLQHGTTQHKSYPKQFQVCPVDLAGAGSETGA